MVKLEDQLENIRKEEGKILDRIKNRNSKRKIQCSCCENFHEIHNLTAIQTHWYVTPSGCTEGDYWNEGEIQFLCPDSGVINRVMFDNYDLEKRKLYDPEYQFKSIYKILFNEIKNEYRDKMPGERMNNYYVDSHRKKFGLVGK